ncbi:squalene--hopene cyclase [Asanoa iriomotensis]|nr:squalene--hopene cyclase [Asanoa iriomotensis]
MTTIATGQRQLDQPPRSVAEALTAAVGHLRVRQDPAGWWKGELATNVTMDAEDLLLRQFLGIRGDQETEEAARWIRSQQRDDGTWANFYGGPGDLSTTVEAYVVLKLAGDRPDEPHMVRARTFILEMGGLERTRVFTRIWMALFGLWSWDDLPELPPEMIFLPRWFPLNVYDWACWARQTVVPLTIVGSLRPVRPMPIGIDELRTGAKPAASAPLWTWTGFFQRTDRLLKLYGRHAVRPIRELAQRRGAEWILARQESDGSWGGIQPPWVYSLLALHLLGYPLDHPALRAAFAGLDAFTIREETEAGWVRRLEACQSPVWDTALALVAMLDAGVPVTDEAVRRATRWLLAEEVAVRGDWAVRRPGLAPGGWAFEFANDLYPDIDDTAEIVLALRRVAAGLPADDPLRAEIEGAVTRGVGWTVGMQSGDGGWGAFDADNTSTLANKLPFCDFGEVIDPPSADVTAHVVEMLAYEGRTGDPATQRGITWLLRNQESDGSWFGRWGANYVYGTGAAVPALVEAGVDAGAPAIRAAVHWLVAHQNPDGGWGEDLRSYDDPQNWAGKGASTPSQTAWALLALLAAGETDHPATRAGIDHLISTQRADGCWDEDHFTGTGFPGDFYINYHLYRLVFPITALGRYLKVTP